MERFAYQAILTPEEAGGYSVEVPDLPGCFTCGDDRADAVAMAADAARTYVASLMLHGDPVPEATRRSVPDGCEDVLVAFETDESFIEA